MKKTAAKLIDKPSPIYKNKWFITLSTLGALLLVIFFVWFNAQPSADYLTKAIDKVGAPSGFNVNHSRDDIRRGPLELPSVRRTYTGTESTNQLRDEMLKRLRDAGFSNAQWQNKSGVRAEGIIATCNQMAIFVSINQTGDDAIDIQAYDTDASGLPLCPLL